MPMEDLRIKQEADWIPGEDFCLGAGLYAGHQVKDEVVIGPDTLQPRDIAYSLCEDNNASSTDEDLHIKEESLNEALFGEMAESPEDGDQGTEDIKQKEIEDVFINSVDRPQSSNDDLQRDQLKFEPLQNYSKDLLELKLQSCTVKVERIALNAFHACNDCLKIFTTEDSLLKHSRYHEANCTKKTSTSKIYICDKCDKIYKNKISIQKHLKMHSTKFVCHTCDKEFTLKHNLIRHSKIHKEKSYNCDECSKKFTHEYFLNRHKKSHSGERYSCEICMKRFTYKCDLNRHTRLHTGVVKLEKNSIKKDEFFCEYCNKQFTYKHHLTRHKLLHTGQKIFMCEECSQRFAQKCHLIRHKQIHTNEKPYLCETCSRRFALKHHLTRHIRMHKP